MSLEPSPQFLFSSVFQKSYQGIQSPSLQVSLLPLFKFAQAVLPKLHGNNYGDNGNHEKIEKIWSNGTWRKEFTNSCDEVVNGWSFEA